MAIDFRQAFYTLDQMGLSDVLLPFLLIFTITFAVFEKTHILGTEGKTKKFSIILAFVMASAVIIPHITGNGPDIIPIINNSLPSVGAVAVAIIMMLFIAGVVGMPLPLRNAGYGGIIGTIAMLIVIYIFIVSAGWVEQYNWLSFLFDSDTQALIVIILVFAIIIGFITGGEGTSAEKLAAKEKRLKWFNDMFTPPPPETP